MYLPGMPGMVLWHMWQLPHHSCSCIMLHFSLLTKSCSSLVNHYYWGTMPAVMAAAQDTSRPT